MTYFPVYMRLDGAPCLVAGGGAVAARRAQKLVSFEAAVMVVAPQLSPELSELADAGRIKWCKRVFLPEDVENKTLVVAATDDHAVNLEIARLCREKNIPVNTADDGAEGSFIFPAIVRRGPLSVAISTGGASPTAALCLKERIEDLLPEKNDRYTEILNYLAQMRPLIKEKIADQHERAELFALLFDRCVEKNRALTEEEWSELIRKEHRNGAE